jgi:CheY-like chemotaxis protein
MDLQMPMDGYEATIAIATGWLVLNIALLIIAVTADVEGDKVTYQRNWNE